MYKDSQYGYSILIPTLENLSYLKLCIKSIRDFSCQNHEIIVHVNNDDIKTIEWLESEEIKFTQSKTNLGVAGAMNAAQKLATRDLLMYINDDMVVLPKWDYYINKYLEDNKIDNTGWICGTLIEPITKHNRYRVFKNYGRNPKSFKLDKLLGDVESLRREKNLNGAKCPPNLIHREAWEKIGGYSEEYWPGSGTDADLAKKMYDIGCRTFVGIGKSLTYHFISVSRDKLPPGRPAYQIFQDKHKMDLKTFLEQMGHKK